MHTNYSGAQTVLAAWGWHGMPEQSRHAGAQTATKCGKPHVHKPHLRHRLCTRHVGHRSTQQGASGSHPDALHRKRQQLAARLAQHCSGRGGGKPNTIGASRFAHGAPPASSHPATPHCRIFPETHLQPLCNIINLEPHDPDPASPFSSAWETSLAPAPAQCSSAADSWKSSVSVSVAPWSTSSDLTSASSPRLRVSSAACGVRGPGDAGKQEVENRAPPAASSCSEAALVGFSTLAYAGKRTHACR